MGSRARRNRHRKLHHTSGGVLKRMQKYVDKELKRMRRREPPERFTGFRVHPEFGWCHRALKLSGWVLAPRRAGQWRKQRDLVHLDLEQMLHMRFVHIPNKGLTPVME